MSLKRNSLLSLFRRSSHASAGASQPPTVDWFIANRQIRRAQTEGEHPLASLYRMYEYLVLDYNPGLRTEIEWFFNHPDWAVAAVPDPKDADPKRYAILAVLTHFLVAAFNRLIERGLPRGSPAMICGDEEEDELRSRPIVLEKAPSWVATVPKLREELVIPSADGSVPDEEICSPQFLSMNIIIQQPHTLFV